MHLPLTKIFSVLGAVLFTSPVFSQQNLRSHSLVSGKKEVKVQTITQDHSRTMWIGTESGLVSYNGISHNIFIQKDGLAHNSITALF